MEVVDGSPPRRCRDDLQLARYLQLEEAMEASRS